MYSCSCFLSKLIKRMSVSVSESDRLSTAERCHDSGRHRLLSWEILKPDHNNWPNQPVQVAEGNIQSFQHRALLFWVFVAKIIWEKGRSYLHYKWKTLASLYPVGILLGNALKMSPKSPNQEFKRGVICRRRLAQNLNHSSQLLQVSHYTPAYTLYSPRFGFYHTHFRLFARCSCLQF